MQRTRVCMFQMLPLCTGVGKLGDANGADTVVSVACSKRWRNGEMGTDRQAKDDASEQVHKGYEKNRGSVTTRCRAIRWRTRRAGLVWFTSLDFGKARRTMLARLCVFPASEHRTDVAFCF